MDGMVIVRKSVSFGIEFAILPLVNAFCLWGAGACPAPSLTAFQQRGCGSG